MWRVGLHPSDFIQSCLCNSFSRNFCREGFRKGKPEITKFLTKDEGIRTTREFDGLTVWRFAQRIGPVMYICIYIYMRTSAYILFTGGYVILDFPAVFPCK